MKKQTEDKFVGRDTPTQSFVKILSPKQTITKIETDTVFCTLIYQCILIFLTSFIVARPQVFFVIDQVALIQPYWLTRRKTPSYLLT